MQGEYNLNPKGKPLIVDLETLTDLVEAGSIHAGTAIRDTVSGRTFKASDHPYLKSRLNPELPLNQLKPAAKEGAEAEGSAPPEDQKHIYNELTRLYRALVWWQIAGLAVLIMGPMVLVILSLRNMLSTIVAAGALFPVVTMLLPLFGLVGLVYALFKKPALRQTIAKMQLDATAWARPMEKPMRYFWIAAAVLTAFTGWTVISYFNTRRTAEREIIREGERELQKQLESLKRREQGNEPLRP